MSSSSSLSTFNDQSDLQPAANSTETLDTFTLNAPVMPEDRKKRFSFAWFFLIFWLTVISTVLISWSMIVS